MRRLFLLGFAAIALTACGDEQGAGAQQPIAGSAVITMAMAAEGKKADVELTYRLKSTNRGVAGL